MKFSVMRDIPDIGTGGELGLHPRAVQVGLRVPEPDRRLPRGPFSRRHVIAGSLFVWSAVTWATGHVTTLRRAAGDARADGHQRGVLHPGGARADRRFPHRAHALARRRPAPDGHLRRRDHRRLQRLRRGRPALGWRWASTPAASSASLRAAAVPAPAESRRPRGRAGDRRAVARRRRCANCCATARSSCSCSTSRCRRWRAGSCATGCRRSSSGVRHRPGQGGRLRHALLAGRRHRRRGRRRLAGRPLDAAHAARPHLTSAPSACR